MDIIDKINLYKESFGLCESGIRNITDLGKEYKTAEIYFHKDLDGVTSAIGMKAYLRKYGIKTIAAHPIQYGGEEYAVPKPQDKTLSVLVDFAHGKPVMKIHTDHHDKQVGVEKGTSTSFVKSPSNAAYISQVISTNDLFPPKDTKIINTVDSADFASQGITPEDIMRSAFKVSKEINVEKNHRAMGFVVNSLTLAYKNKKGFLEKLVLQSKPSLISMYNVIKKLAKEEGYKTPEDVEAGKKDYAEQQAEKFKKGKNIKDLKNGEHVIMGSTIVQYGGGYMVKGYDRYTPFKNHPEVDYLVIAWPTGLIQVSKNPFKKAKNPYNLGDLVMNKVMSKFKSKLQRKMVTLDTIKFIFERDVEKGGSNNPMGFTFADFVSLFKQEIIKNLPEKGRWRETIKDITNVPLKKLSAKQRNILKKVEISLWDVIMAQSGGHKDITNISGFNFYGKGYVDVMKEVMSEIGKLMKNKYLEEL